MAITLRFDIKVLSDYHVGSGYGRGAMVDSTLFRDSDGAPVLRGTTINGLLRYGLWRLMQIGPLADQRACKQSGNSDAEQSYCGQYGIAAPVCPFCRLFGSPAQPKRWQVGSARLTQALTLANKNAWAKKQSDAQVNHRVRVNPQTQRAMPRQLFTQEVGSNNLDFQFEVTSLVENETAPDEAALWVAAARNVRQLGRSRRRGHGECRIALISAENVTSTFQAQGQTLQDAMLDRFQSAWLGGTSPEAHESEEASEYKPAQASVSSQPVYLRLLVRLDEPVLTARRLEAGNQYETTPVINGSTLRGAFAWVASQRWSLDDSLAREDFRRTFVRQGTLFSNLCPTLWQTAEVIPAMPPPLDFQTCKVFHGRAAREGKHGAQVVTHLESDNVCNVNDCREALEPFDWFLPVHDSNHLHSSQEEVASQKQIEMHNAIDPRTNRVSDQGLFGYAALAAGQHFVGDLFFPDAADWQRFQQLTGVQAGQPFQLRLGKASRRGYGKVTAYLEELSGDPPPTLIMEPLAQRLRREGDLKLTLLSDLIMPDRWGRHLRGFEEEQEALNGPAVSKWLQEELNLSLEVVSVVASYRWVDGFQYTQSLPRWRALAIAAGSTVGLKLLSSLTDEQINRLSSLEWSGIGDRRNEGYGRFALNHPIYNNDCQGIQEAVNLDESIRLSSPEKSEEVEFREKWVQELDAAKIGELCKGASFRALASWLHSRSGMPVGQLIQPLSGSSENRQFGEPAQELIESIGGKTEYANREKENRFFREGSGANAGRQQVRDLLEKLDKEYADVEEFHPLGIQMLAERVAGAARLGQ